MSNGIGSDKDLMPKGTKPLPGPLVTQHILASPGLIQHYLNQNTTMADGMII